MATGWPMKTTYANGDVYSASDVNDITGTINLLQTSTLSVSAGKNQVINGCFDIWQRGTSSSTNDVYLPDRWFMKAIGTSTNSQDTDVPTSLGMRYSLKMLTGASSSYSQFQYTHEQAMTIPMRGNVYTMSWYMKANSTFSGTFSPTIYYSNSTDARATVMAGTAVTSTGNTSVTPTTTWTRYSITFTVPTDAVGIGIYFAPSAVQASGAALWIAGVQWEKGSYATFLSRAGGTIQGELAACQRYYLTLANGNSQALGVVSFYNSTSIQLGVSYPVEMRTAPTISQATGTSYFIVYVGGGTRVVNGSWTIADASTRQLRISADVSVAATATDSGILSTNNANALIALTSEL
jgi:hypothetical protein